MNQQSADQLRRFWLDCGLASPAWPAALAKYQLYWDLIGAHNARANLTAAGSAEVFYLKHVADSLAALLAWPELLTRATRLADVGSGAGLPGVVLAIALPKLRVAAIESNQKKAAFVALAVRRLDLADRVDVVAGRSRQLGHDPRYSRRFPVVAVRAVAAADKLIRDVRLLLAPGGSAIFYKTPQAIAGELPLARREAAKHKLTVEMSQTIELPAGAGTRQFMRIVAPQ